MPTKRPSGPNIRVTTWPQGSFRVASAGSKPAGYLHPLAIKALAEIGIDISRHTSKHLNDFLQQ